MAHSAHFMCGNYLVRTDIVVEVVPEPVDLAEGEVGVGEGGVRVVGLRAHPLVQPLAHSGPSLRAPLQEHLPRGHSARHKRAKSPGFGENAERRCQGRWNATHLLGETVDDAKKLLLGAALREQVEDGVGPHPGPELALVDDLAHPVGRRQGKNIAPAISFR